MPESIGPTSLPTPVISAQGVPEQSRIALGSLALASSHLWPVSTDHGPAPLDTITVVPLELHDSHTPGAEQGQTCWTLLLKQRLDSGEG